MHEMRYQQVACWPCSRVVAGLSGRVQPQAVADSLSKVGYELVGDYVGARIPVLVRCLTCGFEAKVRLTNVRSKGSACSACRYAGLSSRYRLAVDEVTIRAAVARLELLEPFAGTHKTIKTRCLECGYVSRRMVNWSKPSSACVRCGHRPFDFTAPSVVYLLRHRKLDAVKIGVSNVRSKRMDQHRRQGWEVIGQLPMSGEAAYLVEQAVLVWWRKDLGLPAYLLRADIPHGGETETVSSALVDVSAVFTFMKEVAAVGSDEVEA